MPLTRKQITDALISRIHTAVPTLNRRTVVRYAKPVDELFESGSKVYNFPFCGVGFLGSSPSEENTNNTKFREDYFYNLLLVCKDTRGSQYAMEVVEKLVDQVEDILIGWEFTGLTGLAPLAIGEVSLVEDLSEKNVAAYTMEITTHQIQS